MMLRSFRHDSLGTAVKLLFLFQGIIILLVVTYQTSQFPAFSESDTLLTRTKSVVQESIKTHSDAENAAPQKIRGPARVAVTSEQAPKEKIAIKHNVPESTRAIIAANTIPEKSVSLIEKVLGKLPASDFPDLKYRPPAEVRRKLARVFDELPKDGFDPDYKNPCWLYSMHLNGQLSRNMRDFFNEASLQGGALACLPYAYVLGQPKCGTSDLFERLKNHPEIRYSNLSRCLYSWNVCMHMPICICLCSWNVCKYDA
jgi:hypothetical protein